MVRFNMKHRDAPNVRLGRLSTDLRCRGKRSGKFHTRANEGIEYPSLHAGAQKRALVTVLHTLAAHRVPVMGGRALIWSRAVGDTVARVVVPVMSVGTLMRARTVLDALAINRVPVIA
jgi:hypothetical protein